MQECNNVESKSAKTDLINHFQKPACIILKMKYLMQFCDAIEKRDWILSRLVCLF